MSGGHFDYDQYRISQIAEDIHNLIERNGSDQVDEWGEKISRDLPPDIIAEFKRAIRVLAEAIVYVERIDYLMSGDDAEDSFRKRLKADLADLKEQFND